MASGAFWLDLVSFVLVGSGGFWVTSGRFW